MLKRIALILMAMLLCLPAALGEDAVLLFEENFDGTELDITKWCSGEEGHRYPVCVWDSAMNTLDGEGHLVLKAEYDAEAGFARCGAIQTRYRWTGKLGYYEASIKLPHTTGLWGAFWIMAGDQGNAFAGANNGVEIDVVESINGFKGNFQFAFHWDGYGEYHKSLQMDKYNQENCGIDVYDGEFHVFAVDRKADGYDFYVDGQLLRSVTPDEVGVCKMDGYMLLTIECAEWNGFGTEKYPDSINELPTEMVVDYIRVWDKKPN